MAANDGGSWENWKFITCSGNYLFKKLWYLKKTLIKLTQQDMF